MGFVDRITGKSGAKAAKSAARTQAEASNRVVDLQESAMNRQMNLLAPYVNYGRQQLGLLDQLNLPDIANFRPEDDPMLQYQNDQAIRAVQNASAAAGKYGSGGMMEEIARQVQGNSYNFQRDRLAQLQSIRQQLFGEQFNKAGFGLNAATGQGSALMQGTNMMGNTILGGANALAAGKVGAANAQAQGANNLLNLGSQIGSAFALMGSDRRLKRNVRKVGKHDLGIGVYQYQYKHSDDWFIGVMADELQAIRPDLVHEVDGYLMVDYGGLNHVN